MNRIAEEIRAFLGRDETEFLKHYGRSKLDGAPGPGSGRYPLGSGEDPNQHITDFITRVKELRKQGLSDKEVAEAVGLKNTTQLRVEYSNAINIRKAIQVKAIKAALADGKTRAQISREMRIPENTIKSMLDEHSFSRTTCARETADFLKKMVDEKGMIDVGTGVELTLGETGISRERLEQALYLLKKEGYEVYGGRVPQATNPGKKTTIKVLCPPGTEHKEIFNYENISTIDDYRLRLDDDGSEHFDKVFQYPASLDSSRVMIRLRDDPITPDGKHTAVEMDGTIEIRRGVKDLDLGNSHYAQVRILVDNDKYMKGMAFYSDNMPDGVDVIFNTNKTDPAKALKDIKKDPDNPFGALIKEKGGQSYYIDDNGDRKLSPINKTREEEDWMQWKDKLPSQFLSKQSQQLIDKQLNLTYADKVAEFEEICSLTNPAVKKKLLASFADDCDAAAVNLQATALPGQTYKVILPVPQMKDNEVYAPTFDDGDTIALIRYPHGGTFEIPILKVNNKQPDAVKRLGPDTIDAVGINHTVAEQLSGADFDGDTVMVIPCNMPGKVHINARPPFEGLKTFDNKLEYGYTDSKTEIVSKKVKHKDGTVTYKDVEVTHYYRNGIEFKPMTKHQTQIQMGIVSNLITDMTLKGASDDEIEKAVKHSMVVIDAEKHKLDWKASETDNDINQLKRRWQTHIGPDGKEHQGASTLISRSKHEVDVLKRQGSPRIDKETGEVSYKEVVETYVDKNGKTQVRTQKSTEMAETRDARKLSSGTPQEEAYAEYANRIKALANEARKELMKPEKIQYSASARETYKNEVNTVMAQLNLAKKNAPRERQAQLKAASITKSKQKVNPDLSGKELRKVSQQALAKSRVEYNAKHRSIEITPKIWEAIQAGAFSTNTLNEILRFTDTDKVKEYATPKQNNTPSTAKQAKIKAMKASGYTIAEIADAVGLSSSTVSKYLK